jgi:hypothetical protein
VHADCASALAMAGAARDDVQRHRTAAEQRLPQLSLFQVLGMLGPVSYDGEPRVVIQDRLLKHHLSMTAPSAPPPPPPIGGDRAAWTSGTQFPPPHEPAAEAASPAVPGPAPAPCYSSRCMHRER